MQAVNTYGNARASNDPNLVNFASTLLGQFMDTLEFDAEPEPAQDEVATEE